MKKIDKLINDAQLAGLTVICDGNRQYIMKNKINGLCISPNGINITRIDIPLAYQTAIKINDAYKFLGLK